MAFIRRLRCNRYILQITLIAICLVLSITVILDNPQILCRHINEQTNKQTSELIKLDANTKNISTASKPSASKIIKIEALSSKEHVFLAVDGLKVYGDDTTSDSSRGIHIVVLNQYTGIVMTSRIFDTYANNGSSDAMVLFLNTLEEGRILVFMVKDEGSAQLKQSGKDAIRPYGSTVIDTLGWRDMWILISNKRNTLVVEAFGQARFTSRQHASPTLARVFFTLENVV